MKLSYGKRCNPSRNGRYKSGGGPTSRGRPSLPENLLGSIITTLDGKELGTIIDFMITYRGTGWLVESIKVQGSAFFKDKLTSNEFSIPGERVSLSETSDKWSMVAHMRVASEFVNY